MKRIRIRAISPSVDEEMALKLARRYRGKLPWQREEVVGVELVFVPYHIFRFRVRSESEPGKVRAAGILAVDSILGNPVLVQGDRIEPRTARVNEEVVYKGKLTKDEAAELTRKRAPELLSRTVRGGVSPRNLDLDFTDSLHLPYWLGVYRRKGKIYYGVVIDGNRADIAPGVMEIVTTAEGVDKG